MTTALPEPSAEYARTLTDRIKVAVEGTWHLITEAHTSRAWAALGYSSWDDYCTREFGTSRLRIPREERSEVVASLRESGFSIRAIESATGVSRPTVIKDLRERHVVNSLPPEPKSLEVALDNVIDDVPDLTHDVALSVSEAWDDEPSLTEEECEALDRSRPDYVDDPELSDAEQARAAEQVEKRITGVDGKSYPKPEPKPANRKPLPDAIWRATYDLGKEVKRLTNLFEDDRFKKNADQIAQANLHDLIRARDALTRVIDQLTN